MPHPGGALGREVADVQKGLEVMASLHLITFGPYGHSLPSPGDLMVLGSPIAHSQGLHWQLSISPPESIIIFSRRVIHLCICPPIWPPGSLSHHSAHFWAPGLMCIIFPPLPKRGMMNTILQMRKLRLREAKSPAQGNTANK